jgi:hypothetical protein
MRGNGTWGYDSGVGSAQKFLGEGRKLLALTIVGDGTSGSYVAIGNRGPVYVPPGYTFSLSAEDLEECYGEREIQFGGADLFPNEVPVGAAPQTWFYAWVGYTMIPGRPQENC